MDNLTSIVDSFEKGTFVETYGRNLSGILGVDVKRQLSDLLLWLNSDFVPCLINEAKSNDIEQIKECLRYAQLIQQKFSRICSVLRNYKPPRDTRHNYTFVCTTCGLTMSPQIKQESVEHCLQQHKHIEENLFNYSLSKSKLCDNKVSETLKLTNNSFASLPSPMTSANNGFSISDDQNVFTFTSSSSSTDKNESPTTSNNSSRSPVEILTKKTNNNNNSCSCARNDAVDFKFNFCIGYHPIIEKKLYLQPKFAKELQEMDGLFHYTLQFKGPQLFSCLLCCCDVPSNVTFRMVKEHILGHRHKKKKSLDTCMATLVAYHNNWTQCEANYQAHQIHFLPRNTHEAFCNLCNSVVSYDLLQNHIKAEFHKDQVMNMHRRDKSSLMHLQASVYSNEKTPGDDHPDDSEGPVNGTMQRSNQRLFANMDKAGSDSEESDNNVPAADEKKSASEPTTSKAEQNSSPKTKQKNHMIIKSINNPAGPELRDMLEHRFLPQLEVVTKLSDDLIECQVCKVRMPKDPAVFKEHIMTPSHRAKSKPCRSFYHFYCEICGILFKQNLQWFDHLKQPRHIERCERLGTSRKNKLTEYECMTCKIIFFGDDLSIKRHITSNLRGIRFRKNKEIVLGEPIKAFFKSEKVIQEQSKQLIAEANQVLAEQDPLRACCRALEAALYDVYPECKVHPFGSRVSGLGNEKSDLDLFVDVGGMYMGQNNQEARTQEKFVTTANKLFRKRKEEFSHVNPIPTARTPIVQVYHVSSKLDCDLSFRHGLSVENTKFLRFCIQLQPVTQPMILLLKQWLEHCKLHENITTYALSMMVIFFLQVKGHLMPVHEMRKLSSGNVIVIDGWEVVDFATVNARGCVVPYTGSIQQLLKEFFYYYSVYAYTTDVICPLLGRSVQKALFVDNPKDLPVEMLSYVQKLASPESELFRARAPFCIQDPFDLSHNLAKACTHNLVEKLKTLCDLTVKYLRISG